MGVVCITLTILLSALLPGADLTAVQDYVYEQKADCHYINGTDRVRFLDRYFYNMEEFVYFDSDEGKYIAKTELGRPSAEYWNKDKDFIEYKKNAVQRFCVHNYDILKPGTADRRVEPSVKISVIGPDEELYRHTHSLICNVYGFYPVQIEVKWLRNGQEESTQVGYSGPYPNGDWTFHVLVNLQTEVEKGDVFTCEVHHVSLKTPLRVKWEPQVSDSAKNKMVTGIVGFVLGGIFIIAGLVIYLRSQKARASLRGHQTEREFVSLSDSVFSLLIKNMPFHTTLNSGRSLLNDPRASQKLSRLHDNWNHRKFMVVRYMGSTRVDPILTLVIQWLLRDHGCHPIVADFNSKNFRSQTPSIWPKNVATKTVLAASQARSVYIK
ncbi:H-2 class II histocompatibility antigen, E-S beta chain [Pelodytes ibericus]